MAQRISVFPFTPCTPPNGPEPWSDVPGRRRKPTPPVVTVNNIGPDSNGNIDIASTIPEVSGKADKVKNSTVGHLAGLTSDGNLTDSGYAPSSFQGALNPDQMAAVNSGINSTKVSEIDAKAAKAALLTALNSVDATAIKLSPASIKEFLISFVNALKGAVTDSSDED